MEELRVNMSFQIALDAIPSENIIVIIDDISNGLQPNHEHGDAGMLHHEIDDDLSVVALPNNIDDVMMTTIVMMLPGLTRVTTVMVKRMMTMTRNN